MATRQHTRPKSGRVQRPHSRRHKPVSSAQLADQLIALLPLLERLVAQIDAVLKKHKGRCP